MHLRVPREDLRVPDAEADIYLVGLGIGGFDRRTVEADRILSECGFIAHLTAFHDTIKSTYSADIFDLKSIYESEDKPVSAYERITDSLLEAVESYRPHGPVAYLNYGHPLWLVDSSWDLQERATQRGFRVKVIPGTSFLDHIIGDLGIRIDHSCQVHEATYFYQQKIRPDLTVPLLLPQFGVFNSGILRSRNDSVSRLAPLVEYLKELYPSDRSATLIMSAWRSDMAPSITHSNIGDLQALVSATHSGVTLVIDGSDNHE